MTLLVAGVFLHSYAEVVVCKSNLQAGNGQNELIKNAPPSTSTANSHEQDEESEPDGEIDIQVASVLYTVRTFQRISSKMNSLVSQVHYYQYSCLRLIESLWGYL